VVLQFLAKGIRQPREGDDRHRIVRFWRAMYDVEMCFGSGLPVITSEKMPCTCAGCSGDRLRDVDLLEHCIINAPKASSTADR
jgi:hypothetical protein